MVFKPINLFCDCPLEIVLNYSGIHMWERDWFCPYWWNHTSKRSTVCRTVISIIQWGLYYLFLCFCIHLICLKNIISFVYWPFGHLTILSIINNFKHFDRIILHSSWSLKSVHSQSVYVATRFSLSLMLCLPFYQ